jgi:Uma2 family endonuclease
MMSLPAQHRYSLQEYLALEDSTREKHEFFDGQVYAMAGVSANHEAITFNLAVAIAQLVRGSECRGHSNEMRIHVAERGLYTYADGSITCGGSELDAEVGSATLLNPKVIFEILSPSTEGYDRGKKFQLYAGIGSLTDYVLISQDEPLVEHFTRVEGGDWLRSATAGIDGVLRLHSVRGELHLQDLYANVNFAPENPLRAQT